MICQSLASIVVGIECLFRFTPDIFCDTTGVPFSYPVAKLLANCLVVSYTHYPIISQVRKREHVYSLSEPIDLFISTYIP